MVKTFQDIYISLEQGLEEVSKQCKAVLTEFHEFESHMVLQPVETVGRRLYVIACWTASSVLARREEHRGKGYVYVVIMEDGQLIPSWFKNKLTVADKKWWKAQGSTILSIEETLDMISELARKLGSGDWSDVVSWIKRCGL